MQTKSISGKTLMLSSVGIKNKQHCKFISFDFVKIFTQQLLKISYQNA